MFNVEDIIVSNFIKSNINTKMKTENWGYSVKFHRIRGGDVTIE